MNWRKLFGANRPEARLLEAASAGDIQTVREACSAGASLEAKDKDSWSPLSNAALKAY